MFLDTTRSRPSPRAKWSVSAFLAKGYVHITNSKQRKHLSPSARCAPVNGLAGCYVSTIRKPHEYFDLTGMVPADRRLIKFGARG